MKSDRAPDRDGYRKITEEDALLLVDTGTVFWDFSPFDRRSLPPFEMDSVEDVVENTAWADSRGRNYQFYWKVEIENDEESD